MALIKAKPTSPGRRFVVSVKTPNLHKGKPFAGLLEKKAKTGGRNNGGRITTRHMGGGHKQRYRKIDFKRTKRDIEATVERIEYDDSIDGAVQVFGRAGDDTFVLDDNLSALVLFGDAGDDLFHARADDRRVADGVHAACDARFDLAQRDLVADIDGGLETGAAGALQGNAGSLQ